MQIKPHPYKFRQDIEIEVIHAQRACRKKDYDEYENSVKKLYKYLGPLIEKWTSVKEVEFSPDYSEDEETLNASREYGKTFYYLSWVEHIERTEGYKHFSMDDWHKLIDKVFRERLLAYKKRGSKSNFLGYLYKWFYFYILTAYRKIKSGLKINAVFNNEELQNVFLEVLQKLPSAQKVTFNEYFFNCQPYKDIARKLNVSQSTVRNNKLKAIRNIKKISPAIYHELKQKFKNSKKIFFK